MLIASHFSFLLVQLAVSKLGLFAYLSFSADTVLNVD